MGVAGREAALVMGRAVVGFGADGVKSFAVKTAPTGRGTCTDGGAWNRRFGSLWRPPSCGRLLARRWALHGRLPINNQARISGPDCLRGLSSRSPGLAPASAR